jgi:hypothetical protein
LGKRANKRKARINESSRDKGILLKAVGESYLKDSCPYTHKIHIKDQGKKAVNWMILDLL